MIRGGRDHFHGDGAGQGSEYIVAMDAHIFEALLFPQARHVERQIVIALGAGGMRLGGEVAMLLLLLAGRRDGTELLFDGLLDAGPRRGVAGHVRRAVLGKKRGAKQ